MLRHWFLFPALLSLAGASCAIEGEPDPATGGTAGAGSATGGAGSGGVAGAGGSSSGSGGSAASGSGAGGTSGTGGVSPGGSSGQGGAGRAGSGASAGTSGMGGAGALAGMAGQGAAASDGGTAGASAGMGGMAGALSGASGSAGAGGTGVVGPDRCDVAIYDAAAPPEPLTLSGSLGTHDPVMIEEGGRWYLFNTGNRVGAKTSNDMLSWQGASAVFSANPSWISSSVPGATNLWAPDIANFGGQFHLYYSASTFGQNRSCIGHATRTTLAEGSFADQGSVVCSNVGTSGDNWNAIDPNVIVDTDGNAWLSFGSFWGGIKMIPLDSTGARSGTMLHSLAARPENGGALEAPFIVRRCGYYYLFVSFDTCCQGVDSDYNIRVGRSATVTGPYVDKAGEEMMQGGGTLLVEGEGRWHGPGHNAVVFSGTKAYNLYHSYDENQNGQSILRISEIAWDTDGWPISGGP